MQSFEVVSAYFPVPTVHVHVHVKEYIVAHLRWFQTKVSIFTVVILSSVTTENWSKWLTGIDGWLMGQLSKNLVYLFHTFNNNATFIESH